MRCLAKYSFLIIFCSGVYCPVTFAEVQSLAVPVDVDVVPECRFSTTPLMFGHYRPHSRFSTESIARVTVLCTLNTPYILSLDQGAGECATTRLRQLSSRNSHRLFYTLSQNPTHTINWGNIIGVDTLLGWGTGIEQSKIIYGEIPPRQNVAPGFYQDVVRMQIIF